MTQDQTSNRQSILRRFYLIISKSVVNKRTLKLSKKIECVNFNVKNQLYNKKTSLNTNKYIIFDYIIKKYTSRTDQT